MAKAVSRSESEAGSKAQDAAEALALRALAFILADERHRDRFLRLSGIAVDGLKTDLADPAVLGGVLDFLLGDEAMLIAFCDGEGIDPAVPGRARMALPGAAPDW